jgi:hypothetical protein
MVDSISYYVLSTQLAYCRQLVADRRSNKVSELLFPIITREVLQLIQSWIRRKIFCVCGIRRKNQIFNLSWMAI